MFQEIKSHLVSAEGFVHCAFLCVCVQYIQECTVTVLSYLDLCHGIFISQLGIDYGLP